MLPSVATIIPLFIFLNQFQVSLGDASFNLRNSLLGVTLTIVAGLLPFAIWNLKGYLDTIPKDLEEAAAVDGATQNQIFRKVVLPLAVPAIAVTGFLGFLAGWTEYLTVALFIGEVHDWTPLARVEQHGRAVRPDDELVAVRGVRGALRLPGVAGVLPLPALPGRRPRGRRRQGVTARPISGPARRARRHRAPRARTTTGS